MFEKEFYFFSQEASLAHSEILYGFECLRRLNAEQRGNFYSSLFHLSIGIERLFKIIAILDFKFRNDLENPKDKHLRNFGHKLTDMYEHCKAVGQNLNILSDVEWVTEKTLEYEILKVLAEFASGSRYYNLDQLVGEDRHIDPVVHWIKIHKKIGLKSLPQARLKRMNQEAVDFCEEFNITSWIRSVDGEYRLYVDHIVLNKILIASSGHCVWHVLVLIRPFYYVVEKLAAEIHRIEVAKGIKNPTVPYLEEFFTFLLSDRAEAIKRKKWQELFIVS